MKAGLHPVRARVAPAGHGTLQDLLARQREAFSQDSYPSLATRQDRLARVLAMTESHQTALVAAISDDFSGRAKQETALSDILTVRTAVAQARRQTHRWMQPRRVPTALQFFPGRNTLMRQPLGVVGVVSPWNYPYQLALCPAVGALAAGNRVMLKPSELTPRFSALLAQMVAGYFDDDELTVVNGDAAVGQGFTQLPLDHLFFTGSTQVGREVAQAAARNLTPVTLELGGKSPAILDASCDISQAAARLAYGKLLNAGQTCIAPDYLLVPYEDIDACVETVLGAARQLYPRIIGNPDYTSIISPHHYQRLQNLLDDAQAKGAKILPLHASEKAVGRGRQFMPTLVLNTTPDMLLMQQEIFGPILPVVPYRTAQDAIDFVNAGERPLALYWFGTHKATRERVLRETVSGGVTINDCIWHLGQENQPFGGVGASGHGVYHGEWGFRTFSKEKPIYHQSRWVGTHHFYPPYGKGFERMMALLRRFT